MDVTKDNAIHPLFGLQPIPDEETPTVVQAVTSTVQSLEILFEESFFGRLFPEKMS